MTEYNPPRKLPSAALLEFTKVSPDDWGGVVPLAELLDRVNRVAVAMTGGEETSPAGRVKPTFTERSLRHYQTLGCIDAPNKHGRQASYAHRHFVQAVLVRRLLSERVPSEQIASLLAERDTKELERMLLGGVEIVARAGSDGNESEKPVSGTSLQEMWNRVRLAPGLELHINSNQHPYKPEESRRLIEQLKKVLRRQGK